MQSMSMVPCEVCHESIPFREYDAHLESHKDKDKTGDKDGEESPETAPIDPQPKFTRGNLVLSCEICGEILPYKSYKQHLTTRHSEDTKKPPSSEITESILIQCETCGENVAFDKYIEHVSFKHSQPVSHIKKMQSIEINVELPSNESQLLRIPFTGKSTEEENVCEICLLDYKEGDMLIYLPCIHRFHESCLVGWLSKKALCPICQKMIFKQ